MLFRSTNLLLKNAEKDPIAKSRLISDVIRSVAVIPDTITRSVYIKECSKLLDVHEDILYTEVRKQKYKQNEDFRKKEMRGSQERIYSEPAKYDQPGSEDQISSELLVDETEYLRFLLKHCNAILYEEEGENPNEVFQVKVGQYMIDELENDDLVPQNTLFRRIFYDVKENLETDNFDTWKHFVYHPDASVSKLATDLFSEKFIESRRWTKAGAYTEKEEDILVYLVPRIIHEFKLRRVKQMMDEIQRIIESSDFEQAIEEQAKYMNLKQVEKSLSDKLGNRAIN